MGDIKEYESKGYNYITNEAGQIIHAEGDLRLEDGERNPYAQRTAGGVYRHDNDDGGHLIGTRFGGSGELDNIVAEDRYINRGAFKSLENEWADNLKEGNDVNVEIDPIYHGESIRPDIITAKTVVSNDEKTETDYFSVTNENLESEEFALPHEADDMMVIWDHKDSNDENNSFEEATNNVLEDNTPIESSFSLSSEYDNKSENISDNSFASDINYNSDNGKVSDDLVASSNAESLDSNLSISDGSEGSYSNIDDHSRGE